MFRWDGGFIMVSWDGFDEGVDWYTKHMGWECLDKIITPVGKKAFLKMPKSGVVTLKSFESDYEHFQVGEGEEGHMRLCFETAHLEKLMNYFKEHQINYSEPTILYNGIKTLDFYGFENARMTVFESNEDKETFPEGRVLGFGEVNSRIGVTDITQAVKWYKDVLGFVLVEEDVENGYALMQTEDAYFKHALKETVMDNIFLEKVESPIHGHPSVRTYFDIRPEEFFDAYNWLIKKGIKPSQIAGNPLKGWGGFHFYDPDGNQINVWSYQMM